MNPLDVKDEATASILSEWNLEFYWESDSVTGTFAIPVSGKWYFEWTNGAIGYAQRFGITDENYPWAGSTYSNSVRMYNSLGHKNYTTYTSYGQTWWSWDVIWVAVNMDDGELTFYKNGVSQWVAFTDLLSSGQTWYPTTNPINGLARSNMNFWQDSSFAWNKTKQNNPDSNGVGDFYYAPPAWFLALSSENM